MTLSYSGTDGGTSFNVARTDINETTTAITRGFLKFNTSTLTGITSAKLYFTMFNPIGSAHDVNVRAGGDIIGDAPNSPSYEDNWMAFDSETNCGSVPANTGEVEIDVLSCITSTITSFRLVSDLEVFSGTRGISIYTIENGVSNARIEYSGVGFIYDDPDVYYKPITSYDPSSNYYTPSGSVGGSGTITPIYDWGIRLTFNTGDEPPIGGV